MFSRLLVWNVFRWEVFEGIDHSFLAPRAHMSTTIVIIVIVVESEMLDGGSIAGFDFPLSESCG